MSRGDFWSRRKAAVESEALDEERGRAAAEAEAQEAELAEKSESEILEELGLPDPDTLGEGDDFKVFLARAVPARIRSRALRRLWASNPVLANVDGLVDYGEDFTDASCVIEKLQTAYQVGRGMTAHVEELARQAEAEEAGAEDAEDAPEAAPVATNAAVTSDAEELPGPPSEEIGVAEAEPTDPEQPDEVAPALRRMRFSFEEARAET